MMLDIGHLLKSPDDSGSGITDSNRIAGLRNFLLAGSVYCPRSGRLLQQYP